MKHYSREGSFSKTIFGRLSCLAIEGLTFLFGSGTCLGPIQVALLLHSLFQSPNCWRQGLGEYVAVQNRLIQTEACLQAPCCGEPRAVHRPTNLFDGWVTLDFYQHIITPPCGLSSKLTHMNVLIPYMMLSLSSHAIDSIWMAFPAFMQLVRGATHK